MLSPLLIRRGLLFVDNFPLLCVKIKKSMKKDKKEKTIVKIDKKIIFISLGAALLIFVLGILTSTLFLYRLNLKKEKIEEAEKIRQEEIAEELIRRASGNGSSEVVSEEILRRATAPIK